MSTACTIRLMGIAAAGALLVACAGRIHETTPSESPAPAQVVQHEGKPYSVVPSRSLLTIRVYRGGTLARMGHNHLVASHDLSGIAHVPEDLTRASFDVRFPVAKLTVDEDELRQAAGADFPPGVPDSAKEGTRRNMLSEALLDAEHYPEMLLRCERVDVISPSELLAHVQVTAKGRTSLVTVPVHYSLAADSLTASGEFSLKHTDLGLTPFTVMLGAMQVQDEMNVRFELYLAPSSVSSESAR